MEKNNRQGQCYRIALAVIQIGADSLVLVHGRIAGIEHAWIVADDGRIYDPVAHALIDASGAASMRVNVAGRREPASQGFCIFLLFSMSSGSSWSTFITSGRAPAWACSSSSSFAWIA
jgi:hypothetical protein